MEQRSQSFRGDKVAKLLPRDLSENLGKLPPQAIDLEETVLGAVMLESEPLQQIIDILRPEDFYLESHREIYSAILGLYTQDNPVDMRTVVSALRKNGRLELVGGAHYIAELTSRVSSAANVDYHARLLQEFSIKRQLILISSQVQHDAYEDTIDCFHVLDSAQAKMDMIGSKYLKGNFQSVMELSTATIRELANSRNNKGLSGIPSGFEKLDRLTGGWQNSDLIIIAARPGMGKTGFLLSAAMNSSMVHNIPTAVFSLEMASRQLMKRAYSGMTEIENVRIFKNWCTDEELARIGLAHKQISKAPLYIDDTAGVSILEFRARARRMVHEQGVKVIYVDYLQLMTGERGGTRDQEIASISGGLKRVAKELNVPVIGLSQLSRATEARGGDKKPQLSDLRESGSIEQDADIVMFLYRPEYYKIMVDDQNLPTQGVMQVIIGKHRNGALDDVPLKFIGKYTKVMDWQSAPTPETKALPEPAPVRPPYRDGNDDLPF